MTDWTRRAPKTASRRSLLALLLGLDDVDIERLLDDAGVGDDQVVLLGDHWYEIHFQRLGGFPVGTAATCCVYRGRNHSGR